MRFNVLERLVVIRNSLAASSSQDFGTTALESAKRMIQWSPFYFTHSTSYYPVPSTQIHLQDFPRMTQQNLPVMSSAQQDLMINWANTHGKCDKQRTVRQETTRYKAFTLRVNMYQTAVHRREGLEFAPVERVEEPEFSKEVGKRRRAYIEGPRRRSALRIRAGLNGVNR